MLKIVVLAVLAIATTSTAVLAEETAADRRDQWPQWRGPLGTGVAPHGTPPLTWNESDNIRWKVAIPGLGHSPPIVWGDRVYLTSAVLHGEKVASPQRDAYFPSCCSMTCRASSTPSAARPCSTICPPCNVRSS